MFKRIKDVKRGEPIKLYKDKNVIFSESCENNNAFFDTDGNKHWIQVPISVVYVVESYPDVDDLELRRKYHKHNSVCQHLISLKEELMSKMEFLQRQMDEAKVVLLDGRLPSVCGVIQTTGYEVDRLCGQMNEILRTVSMFVE